jgi:hypothetical protein
MNNDLMIQDGLAITRSELYDLEERMKNSDLTIQLVTNHFFSPGIYTRILHIPKGCLLTGKIHKEPILNIMVAGEISVLIGSEVKRIKAPYICVSPAGSKKIGYAHEDTIWVGCHGTDDFDLVKIEKRFVAQDEQDWLSYFNHNEQLELPLCG